MKDRFWVVWVRNILTNSKDISNLLDIVIHIVICTLVGKLSQSYSTKIKSVYKNYLSEANYSSRSNKSRLGGGRSLSVGGNTAAYKAGIGVSNYGGMRLMGSCLQPKVS